MQQDSHPAVIGQKEEVCLTKDTLYSIVIPVYNSEQYLHRCFDSILRQEYGNFQVIVVDDGSTDRSPEICDEYARKDARFLVIHKKNEGVSIARNVGIGYAQGEWISFVDSDDCIMPTYLSAFNSIENKADLTYFSNKELMKDGTEKVFVIGDAVCATTGVEDVLLKLKQSGYDYYSYNWNKFYRREIIEKHSIRFVEELYFREDELFVNDYIRHIRTVSAIPDVLYVYSRDDENGLTAKGRALGVRLLYLKESVADIGKLPYLRLKAFECKRMLDFSFSCLSFVRNMCEVRTVYRMIRELHSNYYSCCSSRIDCQSRLFRLALSPRMIPVSRFTIWVACLAFVAYRIPRRICP